MTILYKIKELMRRFRRRRIPACRQAGRANEVDAPRLSVI